jgi:hypothetical protein
MVVRLLDDAGDRLEGAVDPQAPYAGLIDLLQRAVHAVDHDGRYGYVTLPRGRGRAIIFLSPAQWSLLDKSPEPRVRSR